MTLIKSISGIRGTIGGGAGEGLNPLDIVKFTSAYATLIRKTCKAQSNPDSFSQPQTVERTETTQ